MMSESEVVLYANPKCLSRLSGTQRSWCLAQLGEGNATPARCGDVALCQAVLAVWAKRAVPGGIDSMRLQVETNYWDGEPETLCDGRSLAVRFWEWLTR